MRAQRTVSRGEQRAAKRSLRRIPLPQVRPIIPVPGKDPFDDLEWLFDCKYDGFRALCYVEHGRGRFVSQNGNPLSRFDALARRIAAELDIEDAIIDGEVIEPDEIGRPMFLELQRRARKPSYVAFDLLWRDGADLRFLPLSDRRRRLHTMLPAGSPVISEALSVRARGRALFDLMQTRDLEGIVAKRLADPYRLDVRWFKINNPDYSQKEGEGNS